jgi:hypothetical protein
MKNLIEIIKFALIALAILMVGFQLVTIAKTYVRNQAIDGCANQAFYQNQFIDEQGRQVTNREPQKTLYQECLFNKGVSIQE